jgi:hypothetical protein
MMEIRECGTGWPTSFEVKLNGGHWYEVFHQNELLAIFLSKEDAQRFIRNETIRREEEKLVFTLGPTPEQSMQGYIAEVQETYWRNYVDEQPPFRTTPISFVDDFGDEVGRNTPKYGINWESLPAGVTAKGWWSKALATKAFENDTGHRFDHAQGMCACGHTEITGVGTRCPITREDGLPEPDAIVETK